MHDPIGVIANAKSGRNAREAEAIDRAMAVFGPSARLVRWNTSDDLGAIVAALAAEGRRTIVAAGGDGTVTAVAAALVGREGLRLAVLPLGTFNFFARGLGLPEDPEGAARAILAGDERRISVGTVNGQVFLNNASVGIYPKILKEREAVYSRWGRFRLAAHWSVVKTFLRFQRPMRVTMVIESAGRQAVTPLVFVARSAFQLDRYGLDGAAAISDDRFAIFVAKGVASRGGLFRLAWHLVTGQLHEGRDVEMIAARDLDLDVPGHAALVAFDGEKSTMRLPLRFRIARDALTIVIPAPEVSAEAE